MLRACLICHVTNKRSVTTTVSRKCLTDKTLALDVTLLHINIIISNYIKGV